MKIKIASSRPKIQTHRKANSSLQGKSSKKKIGQRMDYPLISLKSVEYEPQHPKYIAMVNQNTEPRRKKTKKPIIQRPELMRQFEQITNIYKLSKEVNNEEEEMDLRCVGQSLDDDFMKRPKSKSYASISNRYSQHSGVLLPSIAEKQAQEEPEDQLMETVMKPTSKRSMLSTATHNRTKNIHSAQGRYVNDFQIQLRSKSKEKKVTVNVQHVIKSRSKTKSSMSNKNNKQKIKDK